MKAFKPMLAETCVNDSQIQFPVYGSIKLDGIRCLIRGEQAVSRALKPIGNDAIRTALEAMYLDGADGEILTFNEDGTVRTLNQINGDVSRSTGEPNWQYHVFDIHTLPDMPFDNRQRLYTKAVCDLDEYRVRAVEQHLFHDLQSLAAFEAEVVAQGHEGVMIRTAASPYKFGRSTVREGWLLKLKRFEDDEAILTGMEELMRNENEAFENELGRTARSTAKDGLVPAGIMGALNLDWNGIDFKLGTGFDADMRADFWRRREQLRGSRVTFKFKGIGSNGRPLIASFKAIRLVD